METIIGIPLKALEGVTAFFMALSNKVKLGAGIPGVASKISNIPIDILIMSHPLVLASSIALAKPEYLINHSLLIPKSPLICLVAVKTLIGKIVVFGAMPAMPKLL